MKYENGLFIFRRDFRIRDNLALNALYRKVNKVYTIFIFTEEQVTKNPFSSQRIIHFMVECLYDLKEQIESKGGKLYTFYGNQKKIIPYLINKLHIDCLAFNIDYTPYARKRDLELIRLCEEKNVEIIMEHDYMLQRPGQVCNGTNDPYRKFTPYYNKHKTLSINSPKTLKINFVKTKDKLNYMTSLEQMDYDINNVIVGGRKVALKQLNRFKKVKYGDHNTSNLSSYIKFGCLSIREIYDACKRKKEFIRQLVWRDFYFTIIYYFPHVLKGPMKENYKKIKWSNDSKHLKAFMTGNTGFPIVDAGIRQLLETGEMDNRVRLIVGSFLVKTLLISWQVGEKFFANNLLDYDVAVNNGNWQWIAGSGTDSQPYFRIFNPWSQGKSYDKDGNYIKRWIPELETVFSNDLHKWNEKHDEYDVNYPKPIVDYTKQKVKVLNAYKQIFK